MRLSEKVVPGVAAIAAAAMLLAQYMIWIWSPVEVNMGLIQKVFYVHVSLAWWGFCSFFLVFAASARHLLTKGESSHQMAGAAAETGVLFSGLVLLTGIAWAKASWNTWWTWDPRLSTALVMWFIYSGYLLLRRMDPREERLRTAAAVLGVVAFLDVPLVFLSARMWRSVHPSVIASREGGLPQSMAVTLGICLLAFGLIWGFLVFIRYRQLQAGSRLVSLLMRERD